MCVIIIKRAMVLAFNYVVQLIVYFAAPGTHAHRGPKHWLLATQRLRKIILKHNKQTNKHACAHTPHRGPKHWLLPDKEWYQYSCYHDNNWLSHTYYSTALYNLSSAHSTTLHYRNSYHDSQCSHYQYSSSSSPNSSSTTTSNTRRLYRQCGASLTELV